MRNEDKKAAIAAYKEREGDAGIYAVRCAASGQTWVGKAPSLGTIRNRLWFGLRMGSDPRRDMQAAWRAHGADSFSFEVLERLDDAEIAYVRDTRLKERLEHWVGELEAQAL